MIAFASGPPANLASPASVAVHAPLSVKPAKPAPKRDEALRSAIVKVAKYYLWMAQGKSPAEVQAMIRGSDSIDWVGHGESSTAFASLTLELAAQAVGEHSWVTGGPSYPWPLHQWADVRVDPYPDSRSITSVLQDAEVHHRWHRLGDGYRVLPGDWVLFDGHVEVVTKCADGVLHTIGSGPGLEFSVSAHEYRYPSSAQGIVGFVNNGGITGAAGHAPADEACSPAAAGAQNAGGDLGMASIPGIPAAEMTAPADRAPAGSAVPNLAAPAHSPGRSRRPEGHARTESARATAGHPWQGPADTVRNGSKASVSGLSGSAVTQQAAIPGAEAIPQPAQAAAGGQAHAPAGSAAAYCRHNHVPGLTSVPGTSAQRAFINMIAPGAIAAQHRYGIPAAVTIAQAIDESGWGQSLLAIRDNNLFGIKGTGPEGSDLLPMREIQNGQWVTVNAAFRVYHHVAESIADHSQLLATGQAYQHAMADRHLPDAFATDLTGVYATDPQYGSNLIALMRLYNLYRYDTSAPSAACQAVARAETGPVRATGKHAQSRPHPAGRGRQQTSGNAQPPPQPAQPAGQDWGQFALTMFGIPIVVNLLSSAAYEYLKKSKHREQPNEFRFHIVRGDGSIIDASFETDDSEVARQIIRAFRQLVGPQNIVQMT